jgi:hypothetical protein
MNRLYITLYIRVLKLILGGKWDPNARQSQRGFPTYIDWTKLKKLEFGWEIGNYFFVAIAIF